MQFADALTLLDAAKVSYRKLYALYDEPKNLVAKMTVLAEGNVDSREITMRGGIHEINTFLQEHPPEITAVCCRLDSFAQLRKDGQGLLDLVTDADMLRAGIAAWWEGPMENYPVTFRLPFIISPQVAEDEVRMLSTRGRVYRFFWLDFDKV